MYDVCIQMYVFKYMIEKNNSKLLSLKARHAIFKTI